VLWDNGNIHKGPLIRALCARFTTFFHNRNKRELNINTLPSDKIRMCYIAVRMG